MMYVPCECPPSGDGNATIDLWQTRDGRLALLVYSALDRLVACCGDRQPWVVMPAQQLDAVGRHTEFDLPLLDVEIPPGLQRGPLVGS